MSKCKLIILNAGHASGKTTLIKNIVKYYQDFEEIPTKYGYFTKVNNTFFIGKVTTKTTGGDQVGYDNIFPIIFEILKYNNNDKTIILESPIFSGNFTRPLKFLVYLYLNYNIEIINILLYIKNFNIIFNRCKNRIGKELTEKQKHHIISAYNSIKRSFIKKSFNWINNISVNIDDMNEQDLLNFINQYLQN
jgi:hypothetical protein